MARLRASWGRRRLSAATETGYDPAGALKTRTYKTSSGTCTSPTGTTNYLLGNLFETNSAGTITTSYVDGPAGDLASFNGAPTTSSTVTYLYYSGHGDLAAEADTSGARTANHTYDPFGAPLDTPPANSTVHRYTGRWDKQYDTTTSLILMGARPYDPTTGRFLAVDPIDGGSANNYDYALQDPINAYDLDGLAACKGWRRVACRVGRVARVASVIPGPVGLVAGAVGAGAFAAGGDYREAALTAATALGGAAVGAALKGTKLLSAAGVAQRKAPVVGADSVLFGRGGTALEKGLLNRGPVRIGWGWKGPAATGEYVFRVGIGRPGGKHLDLLRGGR